MEEVVIKISDGTSMNFETLVCYLRNVLLFFPERSEWSFDELTGGRDCFFSVEAYLKTKKWYEEYKIDQSLDLNK